MYTANSELGTTTVPAFLSKLWMLVEDPGTNELICWDSTGKSFHVLDQGRFAKEILPMYFKHNNMASFIRQLNMYGFRKVMTIEAANIKVEKDDIEFAHPYFVQGQEGLLEYIKRKAANTKPVDGGQQLSSGSEDLTKVCADLTALRGKQESMTSNLEHLKIENEVLWKELVALRQRHMKQEQIVNKLIQFLVTLVGDRTISAMKRKLPLMLEDAADSDGSPLAKVSRTENQPTTSANVPINSLMNADSLEPLAIVKDGDAPTTLQLTDFLEDVEQNPMGELFASDPVDIGVDDSGLMTHDPTLPSASTSSLGSLQTTMNNEIPSFVDPNSVTIVARTFPGTNNDFNKDKMAKDLESMQSFIDNVQGLMSSDQYNGYIDSSTLFELLEDDDAELPGLENSRQRNDTNCGTVVGNELMQYNPKEEFDFYQLIGEPSAFSNPISPLPGQPSLEDILEPNQYLSGLDRLTGSQ